jgi:ribosomal protein S18 acetylase RimI-like enzyme
MKLSSDDFTIRAAKLSDLDALMALENNSFTGDRLSRRSMRHYLQSEHSALLVAEANQSISQTDSASLLGYGLIWLHRGTRLARLYSLAVAPEARGQGIAKKLLAALERVAEKHLRLFMRLEVSRNNLGAIRLYQSCGYRIFGEFNDYYDDHSDALRMQKKIRSRHADGIALNLPWYQQSTEFTCGPAALMMAMASLDPQVTCHQSLELQLWREATTIFMTTGHGGCHPLGLALAAKRRGFETWACINTDAPLFVEGVRSIQKKQIMTQVHYDFVHACQEAQVDVTYQDITQSLIEYWMQHDFRVLVLISTYRLDGKKAPHWVVVTGIDSQCLYVHDPDCDESEQLPIDCQHIPIARDDFDKMSVFGSQRLRCAVALRIDGGAGS